jgi:hypothetical protein
LELDFGFARHGRRLQEGARERKRRQGTRWGEGGGTFGEAEMEEWEEVC